MLTISQWYFPAEEAPTSVMLRIKEEVYLLVGCLTSQQHASVSRGRICSDNFTCCHTETEVAEEEEEDRGGRVGGGGR